MSIANRIPWFNRPRRARVVDVLDKQTGEVLETRPLFIGAQFVPDPVPMQPPLGYTPQPSMFDVMRQMIEQNRLSEIARAEGQETLEESEDFEINDETEEYAPSRYIDEEPSLAEIVKTGQEIAREREELARDKAEFAALFAKNKVRKTSTPQPDPNVNTQENEEVQEE